MRNIKSPKQKTVINFESHRYWINFIGSHQVHRRYMCWRKPHITHTNTYAYVDTLIRVEKGSIYLKIPNSSWFLYWKVFIFTFESRLGPWSPHKRSYCWTYAKKQVENEPKIVHEKHKIGWNELREWDVVVLFVLHQLWKWTEKRHSCIYMRTYACWFLCFVVFLWHKHRFLVPFLLSSSLISLPLSVFHVVRLSLHILAAISSKMCFMLTFVLHFARIFGHL